MNKQHILNEIKRTAASNGGVPLGRLRFEGMTGIRESNWRGRHWARWADALSEAGFAANKLNPAFEDAHLLAKLAALTRELGRFPTAAEMQLQRRRDPEFPSQKVYERFGLKAQQAKKLLVYCSTTPGLEEVAELCRGIASGAELDSTNEQSDDSVEYGFVYLRQSGRYYKIGRSNAAGRREREVQLQMPERATKVHEIRTDDPPGIEAYWHRRFAEKRRGGEWFELTADDVRVFKRRKFM